MSRVTVLDSEVTNSQVLLNSNWLCSCFALPADSIDQIDLDRRLHSPTDYMVGDSTIGGGPAINMPPGWTRTADIPASFGMRGQPASGYGTLMGEMIIQNLDLVHIRAGLPEYNSLTNFWNRLYDSDTAALANDGKSGVLDTVITLAVKAAGWYISIPILPFIIAGRFMSWLSGKPYASYYYLRPSMDLFWMAFNTAVNALAINMGLGIQSEMKKFDTTNGQPIEADGLSEAQMSAFNKILPDIYSKSGYIDMYAASTRHKRLQAAYARYLATKMEGSTSFEDMMENIASTSRKVLEWSKGGFGSIVEMMSAYSGTIIASEDDEITKVSTREEMSEEQKANLTKLQMDALESPMSANDADRNLSFYESDYASHAAALAVSGGDFITFAVDYVKEVSFGISNSTGESSVASSINGMVSSARGAKFSVMHGNYGDGILAGGFETVTSLANAIGKGAAEFAGLNILNAMAGNGFVDIPDVWQDSETEMPGLEYGFTVVAPSAHPLAKFQMMIPILALVCLASPRSTGAKSYTAPFLLEVAHRSRNHVPMGIMRNLTIDFSNDRDDNEMALSAKVSFGIASLSNKLYIPIDASVSNFFSEDSNFNDMLKIMGGVTLHDRDSTLASLKRKYNGWMNSLERYTNASWYAQKTVGKLNSGALGLLLPITRRN